MNQTALHESLADAVSASFARSGGTGGQNVNKLNTKVHLSCPLAAIGGLSDQERSHIRRRLTSNLTKDDVVYIDVQDERTQERNRAIALDRLEAKLIAAARIPARRKKTRPSAAAKERRLHSKKLRALLKTQRHSL